MKLSVIIPTVDEADHIGVTIAALNREDVEVEVIVADGGSIDETCDVAEKAGADLVFRSEKIGRSRQMNAGAARATGTWLIFLHADTILPGNGLAVITSLPDSIVGGAFQRRFDSDSRLLALTAHFSDFRSQVGGIFLGDQAIFVRRSVFEKMGGYDEQFRVAEEFDFCRRLKKHGDTVLLPGPAISSARRFENREFRQSVKDVWLTVKFFLAPQAFTFSETER